MKIAVIGAGFSGLAVAWDLRQAGNEVDVFEAQETAGGLAGGFKHKDWEWSLEKHYHHVFVSDQEIKSFLQELELEEQLQFYDVFTGTYFQNQIAALDSPLTLLRYPFLTFIGKLRTALTLAFLKFWPWGEILERWTAEKFLKITNGRNAWQVLWQPLFEKKFGKYSQEINAAWFWARIHSRSKKLGYFTGGFQSLVDKIVKKLSTAGVNFYLKNKVDKIEKKQTKQGNKYLLSTTKKRKYDAVVFTGNSQQLLELIKLPKDYQQELKALSSLGAMTLVLELTKPFFDEAVYWLNINDLDMPFLAVVEQTNLISSSKYNRSHLVYVGNYLSPTEKDFKLNKKQVFKKYQPFLEQLSPGFSENIKNSFLFKNEAAQPVVGKNYSRILPKIITPYPGLYWAGMQQIYPFDRGVNYAVKIGRQAAAKILTAVDYD
ncbi:MAG: FAD-dependent oxidoreductase [Patescibacteria group bacterium]|nr:FAD-dependent oxidoreductase [Patescibacteria group bacterium]